MDDSLVDTNPYDFIDAVPDAPAKPKRNRKFTNDGLMVPRRSKSKKKVVKAKKTARSTRKRVLKRAKAASPAVRSERADLRLTKAEKAKLVAKAKKTRRTVTSVMLELIEKMRP